MKIKVVVETDAGEIVACAETPSFDIDDPGDRLMARMKAQRLVSSAMQEALDK